MDAVAAIATGTLVIVVNYDDYLPVFSGQLNGIIIDQISENIPIGTPVVSLTATDQDIEEDNRVCDKEFCNFEAIKIEVFITHSYSLIKQTNVICQVLVTC